MKLNKNKYFVQFLLSRQRVFPWAHEYNTYKLHAHILWHLSRKTKIWFAPVVKDKKEYGSLILFENILVLLDYKITNHFTLFTTRGGLLEVIFSEFYSIQYTLI